MTESAPMRPWLAGLIGIVILFVVTGLVGLGAHPGIVAALALIGTGAGAYVATRLSRAATPAWAVGAAGLLGSIGYLFLHGIHPGQVPNWLAGFSPNAVPLWLMASLLGAPLLGARLGIGAAR